MMVNNTMKKNTVNNDRLMLVGVDHDCVIIV